MPAPYCRTFHMLISAWGERWKQVHLAMFTAYLDDSGSAPNQHVANATALIIPGARIIALQREWDAFRAKWGFADFHTSAFVAKNPKEGFGDLTDENQRKMFLRVRQIVKKYGVKIMSFTVHKKDYDEVIPADLRAYAGRSHYAWAIRHVVRYLSGWRSRNTKIPLEYMFDYMKPRDDCRKEIETIMEQAEWEAVKQGRSGEFTNFGFRYRKDIPGLQCVDCVAWTTYQVGLLAFLKKPMHPLASIAWDDLRSRNEPHSSGPHDWLSAATVTRANLQKWIQDEIKDGKSIKRFKEWEAEDAAKANPPKKRKASARDR
jgi:hypothetical protein